MTSKRYGEAEKIGALAILRRNNGDITKTSEETGVLYATLVRWEKQQRESGISLDERLERLAHQLVAAMPEKLNEADLNQLTRALTVVLNNLKRSRTEADTDNEERGDVYEKLAHLIAHYHNERRTSEDSERSDEA